MKYYLIFFQIIIVLSVSYGQPQLITKEAEWHHTIAMAKRLNKPVLIDFFTTWCGPCKQMDKTVFNQDSVQSFLQEHFISIKVDAEKGVGKMLKQTYNVAAYPTFLFVDDELLSFHLLIGARTSSNFIQECKKAIELYTKNRPLAYYQRQYKAGNRNPKFVKDYIRKLMYANSDSLLHPIMQDYLSRLSQSEMDSLETIQILCSYVKSCNNSYFSIISRTRTKRIENSELRLKIAECYDVAINNCLKEAIAKKDTNIFNVVLTTMRENIFDLDVDRSIMNVRLQFYNKYDSARQIYAKWVVYYMDFYAKKTINDLRAEGELAANKIFKEKPLNPTDKELFIQKWIDSDTQSIAGDLNSFSQKLHKDFSDQQHLEMVTAWSQRACELQPIAEHYDTYAHFLYKLKKYEEAIKTQRKAVALAIKNNEEKQAPLYERELQSMIEGQKNQK